MGVKTGLLLGLNGLNHDPAVALVDDGDVICAIESEKVTRHKQEINFLPHEAIQHVLRATAREWQQVAAIVLNFDAGVIPNRFFLPHVRRMLSAGSWDPGVIANVVAIMASHHPSTFRRLNHRRIPPVVRVRHHLAHVASTFLWSPFDSAAVAVIDASGELECTSLYQCEGRQINRLGSMDLPADSIGYVYLLATRHLGYGLFGDEYKVMGLSAHGGRHDRFRQFFADLIKLLPDGRYRVDATLAGPFLRNSCRFPVSAESRIGRPRAPDDEMSQAHKDFAYELQRRVEEAVLHVVRHLRTVTRSANLCLAGGVALNSVANGCVRRDGGFNEVFIPPSPHDAGTAAGAAMYHHFYTLGGDRPPALTNAYLGPGFSDVAIEHELTRCHLDFTRVAEPHVAAAELISKGRVVAWFQGATEFGPRALGNRSILADPRDPSMRDHVNRLVKEREGYRPFAPALLAERAQDYFSSLRSSPFMLLVDTVVEAARPSIAATVHVDGTARPQIVRRSDNARFYDLIAHFDRLTGVPAVLNTSFNVAGEAMVNTPADAIRCYYASGLDALVIGSFVLTKPHVT